MGKADDFYKILGVDKGAGFEKIKQAYRREAKKCHPDASGTSESAERFRALEEAYETLRDTDRRRSYDRGLERKNEEAGRSGPSRVRPHAVRPAGFESPLRASRPVAGAGDLFAGLFGLRGMMVGPWSTAEFLSRPTRPSEPLLEVILSPGEALRGVEIPIDVPVVLPCPRCEASGFWERLMCGTCGGAGMLRSASRVRLEIPAGVRHGTEFLFRLGSSVADGASFRVRVLVEPA